MSREHGLDDEATLRSAMNAVTIWPPPPGACPVDELAGAPAGPPPEEQFSLGLSFLPGRDRPVPDQGGEAARSDK